MAFDFKFDPVTKDFILGADGSFELTETAETAVLHQLECHLGEWWLDPDAGSRLHDLRAAQADPLVFLEDEARRALGVLVERGRIADVDVIAEEGRPGRINVATRFRDVSSGQLVDTFIKAGG